MEEEWTYNVVKNCKVENQSGTPDTSKVLLLISLHIEFSEDPWSKMNNSEYNFQLSQMHD